MCLLVLQKEGSTLTYKELSNSNDANPDGIGYSFVNNDKLITKKFRNFKKFVSGYDTDTAMYGSDSPFLLHFRLATHGSNKGVDNVHPFKVRDDLVFAHNGVISNVSDSKHYSDTQMFNKEILQQLKPNFLKSIVLIKLIEEFVSGSKLAFLNEDRSFNIINESAGHWNEEKTIWFSNRGYEERKYTYGYSYGWGGHYNPAPKNRTNYGSIRTTSKNGIVTYTPRSQSTDQLGFSIDDKGDEKMPVCEWCGMESGDLKKCDVSDYYVAGYKDTITAELCPECVKDETVEREDCDGFNL